MDASNRGFSGFPHVLTVPAGAAGGRLDRIVATAFPGAGRAAVARLIAAGGVRLNGRPAKKGDAVAAGDVIALAAEPGPAVAEPDPAVALSVVHEDPRLVVVDKPAGQPTHPLRPGELGTLASGLLARYPEMADVGYHAREPGLLHRLDTGTSGLLLAARDAETFAALRAQLSAGEIHKTYLAICSGDVEAPQTLTGHLEASGATVRMRAAAGQRTREARLEVLEARPGALPDTSVVRVAVAFAARHQIRAQLTAAGHPLLGDTQYGGQAMDGLQHHLLHAEALRFRHPVTGDDVDVRRGPPGAWAEFDPTSRP